MNSPRLNSSAFTIVELMISTAIFSSILLLCSVAFIQVGRMFYKGVTTARTQDVTRSVTDEIARTVQFSSGNITSISTGATSGIVCVGGTHFIYNLNQKVISGVNALQRAATAAGAACGSQTSGTELLGENMRLVDFSVSCDTSSDLCDVKNTVAFGDDDLLDIDTAARTATCRGGVIGTQFCAVSSLRTTIIRRVK